MPLDLKEIALVQSLVGRTITHAVWEDAAPNESWTGHEYCRIWLDDGRIIEFGGWGYDAWGATVELVEESTHC